MCIFFPLWFLLSLRLHAIYKLRNSSSIKAEIKTIKCHLCKIYRLYMYMYPCTWTDGWNLFKKGKYFCYFNLHLSSKTTWKTECLADLLETDFSITLYTLGIRNTQQSLILPAVVTGNKDQSPLFHTFKSLWLTNYTSVNAMATQLCSIIRG